MLILAGLVIFGIALGFVSLDFYTGILGVTISPGTGTLVVKVMTGTAVHGTPIADAQVLVDAGVAGKTSELLQTNSSGEARVQLQVGSHTLVVFGENDQFSTPGTSVSVQNKATTTADVYVKQYLVRPVLTALSDPDDTGYDSIWSPITTEVNASSANLLLTSGAVFFNAEYAPGTTSSGSSTATTTTSSKAGTSSSPSTTEVRAILYSQPVGGGTTGLWWISWEPTVPLPLSDFLGLTLSVYSASIQVQIVGP